MKCCLLTERANEFDLPLEGLMDMNDANIAMLLGATRHFTIQNPDVNRLNEFNVFIVKMSKVRGPYEKTWMEYVHRLKDRYPDRFVIMYQEAELDWLLQRSIEEQVELIHAVKRCNLFFAHNSFDCGFYGNLGIKALPVPSPLPLDRIRESIRTTEYRRRQKQIIFGSSFDNRANGLMGLVAARKALEGIEGYNLIQYTRSHYYDNRNDQFRSALGTPFKTIPHMSWPDFCDRISEAYISMNLMPAAAAGRDTIAFAALGIPHIGNCHLDAMQLCFPALCVDVLDINKASRLMRQLILDQDFYNTVSFHAQQHAEYNFSFAYIKDYLHTILKEHLGLE